MEETSKQQNVSIVIPTYNEEENIWACINSLKAQEFEKGSFEIIIIDNNSMDNTVQIIEKTGIPYMIEHKKGPSAARNAGIKKAQGDIVALIDADCVAGRKWLSNIMSNFEDESIGCVAGEIMAFAKDHSSEIENYLVNRKHLSQEVNVKHHFLPYGATANVAYRRNVFDKIGLFDEDMLIGEDADLSWRMQLFTDYKLKYEPEAFVFHPHEEKPKNLFRQKRKHACGAVMLYKKYRKYRRKEIKSLKHTYWEYRSIFRRGFVLFFNKIRRSLGLKHTAFDPVDKYQLFLEIASKVGLIQGSIRHRVWFI